MLSSSMVASLIRVTRRVEDSLYCDRDGPSGRKGTARSSLALVADG